MDLLISLISSPWLGLPVWVWLSFLAIVLIILAIDLGLFHRDAHAISMRESAMRAGFCSTLGLAFSGAVWWLYSGDMVQSLDPVIAAAEPGTARAWTAWELYLTGWVVEQTLAFDNIFVMSMIFTYFAIPQKYQHRVLFYGILGVIILRAIMISLGAALVHQFGWILYLFSAFLILTGIKMLMYADAKPDIANNPVLTWMRRHITLTDRIDGQNFFVYLPDSKTGKIVRHATPLFVALIMIEFADLIFAVDSVPAIFAITQDPFIAYTSNIFAILGLRSLYFVLSAMVHRFDYLKYALALVLIFVGAKIFIQQFTGKIPPEVSLGITATLLIGGIVVSLLSTRRRGSAVEESAKAGKSA